MKIYLAGFTALKKNLLPQHYFYRKKRKLNRLISYFDIKENRSYTLQEFEIIKKYNEKQRFRTSPRT